MRKRTAPSPLKAWLKTNDLTQGELRRAAALPWVLKTLKGGVPSRGLLSAFFTGRAAPSLQSAIDLQLITAQLVGDRQSLLCTSWRGWRPAPRAKPKLRRARKR